MKSIFLMITMILLLSSTSFTQHDPDRWKGLDFLIGTWKGEGNGKPGQGEGTFSGKKNIIFTSDKILDAPRFRLTYTKMDDVTINTRFEISKDGENFFTYLEGESTRVK